MNESIPLSGLQQEILYYLERLDRWVSIEQIAAQFDWVSDIALSVSLSGLVENGIDERVEFQAHHRHATKREYRAHKRPYPSLK